jgi:hypothetical protein
MATPLNKPTTPGGLAVVSGGSGYIAGYCIAQLLNDGWSARTTLRDLTRAEDVRSAIGKIAANANTIEFVAADLNSDAGPTTCSMSLLLSRQLPSARLGHGLEPKAGGAKLAADPDERIGDLRYQLQAARTRAQNAAQKESSRGRVNEALS